MIQEADLVFGEFVTPNAETNNSFGDATSCLI